MSQLWFWLWCGVEYAYDKLQPDPMTETFVNHDIVILLASLEYIGGTQPRLPLTIRSEWGLVAEPNAVYHDSYYIDYDGSDEADRLEWNIISRGPFY